MQVHIFKEKKFISLLLVFFFFISCSKKDDIDSITKQELEVMDGKRTLEVLLKKNDNDVMQLSRISSCPIGPLTRVLKGKMLFTSKGLSIIKNIASQVLVDKTTSLDKLDPAKQTWAHMVDRFLTVESYLLRLLLAIVGIIIIRAVGISTMGPILLVYLGFILIFKFYIYFYQYPADPDLAKNIYNVFWENSL